MFKGFDRELFQFFADLAQNNDRDWFAGHRYQYREKVADPCISLIRSLKPELAGFDPPHRAEPKIDGSLRRIGRDIRFSKDRRPYHTYQHLIFWTGAHPLRSPGLHVVLSAGGLGMGAGHWAFDKQSVGRYRTALARPALVSELRSAIEGARGAGCFLEAPALKRVPKEVAKLDLEEKLTRQTGIVVRTRNEALPDALLGPQCTDYLLERLRALVAVNRWLCRYVFIDKDSQNTRKPKF